MIGEAASPPLPDDLALPRFATRLNASVSRLALRVSSRREIFVPPHPASTADDSQPAPPRCPLAKPPPRVRIEMGD